MGNSPESSESFPNHFDWARPWIQDLRSKIAQRSCAGDLGSNAQPNHPNHFRIVLIRARPWIQDPRSKIAQASCRGILDQSWILDPGPNQNDSDDSVSLLIRHLSCHDSYNI